MIQVKPAGFKFVFALNKNSSRLRIVEYIVSIKCTSVDLFELLISNTDESHYYSISLDNLIVKKGGIPAILSCQLLFDDFSLHVERNQNEHIHYKKQLYNLKSDAKKSTYERILTTKQHHKTLYKIKWTNLQKSKNLYHNYQIVQAHKVLARYNKFSKFLTIEESKGMKNNSNNQNYIKDIENQRKKSVVNEQKAIHSKNSIKIYSWMSILDDYLKKRQHHSLYIFSSQNKFRRLCQWFVESKWCDNILLSFIGLNCITLAMERPTILSNSLERAFLSIANNVFTAIFASEMLIKIVASSMIKGSDAYFTSGWNIMDGILVLISIIDLFISLISTNSSRILGILKVFRLLRSLRPLRVINRAPGLKLVVLTLISSVKPIGNIVLICCTFFIIFGILGVQLFKGTFFYCDGPNITNVRNKTDCLMDRRNVWINRKYNFDNLGKALMSLFVLSSRDGWVDIMYTGIDAVGIDQQPKENFSEWRILYFISFILVVGFFILNMFVGVVVENFHRCREEQEKEERLKRALKKAQQIKKHRKKILTTAYYKNYSKSRLYLHSVVTSKYFDLAIAAVIGLNVVTMAMEFYMMPKELTYALKIFNYFFTAVFILESLMKILALGIPIYFEDKWNKLDEGIVILSVVGIILEEVQSKIIPINPTIIRVMRVLRIARVLKLLKMAKGIRALLDTVMQALPQVGNLGLLFFLLFFIFAALGVELFGRLECSSKLPCQGLGEHAHFNHFGMAFLTLFRVATGDNWNGIMKDTLREHCDDSMDCVKNCCVSTIIAPLFFVIFVLMAQFVLVNVVIAVLMKHLEESHKQIKYELDIERKLKKKIATDQEKLT
ncbi:voltage-dependent T-type calcium channel subunit alpha-1G [Microplitis mediator]|uniref:voltage-dependent T-type calcium channel subunit alpha-1G n=1 Tax=Microplitis mediator TaxID=375433 RepID=UPI0025565B15|nr:voltage-dependent T-type calcium channel subunit alpha-1G [Microplitis mediator]